MQRFVLILMAAATCGLFACKAPPKDPSCPNSLCSDHGVCAAPGEFPTCACDPGYEGATCALCSAGFHNQGGACVADDVCLPTSCGVHGVCNVDAGVAYCLCEDGYNGEECTACYVGYHESDPGTCVLDEQCLTRSCSEAGTCTVDKGLVQCACDAGYTGSTCEQCAMGYHRGLGDACIENDSCATVDPCAHPGECDDSTGVSVCACLTGFTGATCSDCYPGYHAAGGGMCVPDTECIATSCSGNGTCDGTGGVVTCTCDAEYTGASCTECAIGHHLVTNVLTSFACVADESCGASAPAPCMSTPIDAIPPGGSATSCDDSSKVIVCQCAEGYTGALCDSCAVGFRDTGATGPTPFCVPKEHCLLGSCGFRADGTTARGACDDSTGIVVCTCDVAFDYVGTYCEDSIDNCANNSCSNLTPGVCIDLDVNLSAPPFDDQYGLPPLLDANPDGKNDGDYVCVCPNGPTPTSNGHECKP